MYFMNPLWPPRPENDQDLIEKLKWFDSFQPDPKLPTTADFFHNYARQKFQEYDKSYSDLDERANRLLQLTGAFVGVMVAGIIGLDVMLPWVALIPFGFFSCVMCIAVNVQSPRHRDTISTVKDLLETATNVDPQDFDLWMARMYYDTTLKLLVPYKWKADCLQLANRLFVFGVVSLILIPFWNHFA